MPRRSEELEKEAEQIRARLADTLEELRQRLSPSNLAAPLPVAVLGVGAGWLLLRRLLPLESKEKLTFGGGADHRTPRLTNILSRPPVVITGFGLLMAALAATYHPTGETDSFSKAEEAALGTADPAS